MVNKTPTFVDGQNSPGENPVIPTISPQAAARADVDAQGSDSEDEALRRNRNSWTKGPFFDGFQREKWINMMHFMDFELEFFNILFDEFCFSIVARF